MKITLILRNGKRIKVEGLTPEYLEQLLGFHIFAGYILTPTCCDPVKWS